MKPLAPKGRLGIDNCTGLAMLASCVSVIVTVAPWATLIVEFDDPANPTGAPFTPNPRNGTACVPPVDEVSCTVTEPGPAKRLIEQSAAQVWATVGHAAGGVAVVVRSLNVAACTIIAPPARPASAMLPATTCFLVRLSLMAAPSRRE